MDAQSQYLVQALQGLQQAPQAAPGAGVDPMALAGALKQRKAYEAQNPGQSYLGHNLMQAGRNVGGAPQAMIGGLAGLIPPKFAGGLVGLGLQRLFK